MECLLSLVKDVVSPWIIEVGLWELQDVSELLFSPTPCPLPTTHNLSKILRDRDGSNCIALLFLLPFLSNLPFFRKFLSFIFSWLICFWRQMHCSGSDLSKSSSVLVVLKETSRLLLLMVWTPAAALTCSKKRTCTTTRTGSLSFCAACMDTSVVNFLISISPHNFFLSDFVKLGCSCKHNKSVFCSIIIFTFKRMQKLMDWGCSFCQ